MHVAAAIVCLILIIVLIKRLAFRQRPSDAPGVHSKRRVWILPLADRIPYVSRPIRFVFVCLDVANAILILGFILVFLWVLLVGPIRPIHEWFR